MHTDELRNLYSSSVNQNTTTNASYSGDASSNSRFDAVRKSADDASCSWGQRQDYIGLIHQPSCAQFMEELANRSLQRFLAIMPSPLPMADLHLPMGLRLTQLEFLGFQALRRNCPLNIRVKPNQLSPLGVIEDCVQVDVCIQLSNGRDLKVKASLEMQSSNQRNGHQRRVKRNILNGYEAELHSGELSLAETEGDFEWLPDGNGYSVRPVLRKHQAFRGRFRQRRKRSESSTREQSAGTPQLDSASVSMKSNSDFLLFVVDRLRVDTELSLYVASIDGALRIRLDSLRLVEFNLASIEAQPRGGLVDSTAQTIRWISNGPLKGFLKSSIEMLAFSRLQALFALLYTPKVWNPPPAIHDLAPASQPVKSSKGSDKIFWLDNSVIESEIFPQNIHHTDQTRQRQRRWSNSFSDTKSMGWHKSYSRR